MTAAVQRPFRATYRLQFNRDFGFDAAAAQVPYLAALGVSHVYASPYMRARPGSTHGYDIVDHNALNPELGPPEAFERLLAALRDHGMGQILDFVPNHVGIGGADNPWWLDVLEWGRDAEHAGTFDIDWWLDRDDPHPRILVPFLGEQYGRVLEDGGLVLRFDAAEGSFAVWAYDHHKLPVSPLDYGRILGSRPALLERLGDAFHTLPLHRPHTLRRAAELKRALAEAAADPAIARAIAAAVARLNGAPGDRDRLDALIARQNWRAAHFRAAADEINYRRFFNVNELAGLRQEAPEVFEATHGLVLRLIGEGHLDGLRIDHIDGLLDPRAYCERLRERAPRPVLLLVEKILASDETLPEDWPVDGTTGYEVAALLDGLFIDPAGRLPLSRLSATFSGERRAFPDIVREAKLRIMRHEMASELGVLAREAVRIADSNRLTMDYTENALRIGIREIIAGFPVYRTYIDAEQASPRDREQIGRAVALARKAEEATDATAFGFLEALLSAELVAEPGSGFSRSAVHRFAMRVQQYSGPVMAKGLEDTAFYRYHRLAALNEVGADPDRFGLSPEQFHEANRARAARWPRNLLTSSTHDTKRGEDVRARLALLSELHEDWEVAAATWTAIIHAELPAERLPDGGDEYLLYQLMLGSWPAAWTGLGLQEIGDEARRHYAERLKAAMVKSVREAKRHSTWASPSTEYEAAATGLVEACLASAPFLQSFLPFQARIAALAVVPGLARTLLKLTLPGIPDIYQGAELWELSLVDPDNRRPVDYARRRAILDGLGTEPDALPRLLEHWQDGAVKLALIARILAARRASPALFAEGEYRPLDVGGPLAGHICAFARILGDRALLVAVPRLTARLATPDWLETAVEAPGRGRWRSLLTGTVLEPRDGVLAAADLFGRFPVALLASLGQEAS